MLRVNIRGREKPRSIVIAAKIFRYRQSCQQQRIRSATIRRLTNGALSFSNDAPDWLHLVNPLPPKYVRTRNPLSWQLRNFFERTSIFRVAARLCGISGGCSDGRGAPIMSSESTRPAFTAATPRIRERVPTRTVAGVDPSEAELIRRVLSGQDEAFRGTCAAL